MKNITLSADEGLIEQARERARRDHTTLNEQFRRWLVQYARSEDEAERTRRIFDELQASIRSGGRKFTRDEMNER